ncbi:MAG: hypothetical protein M1837_004948 [Sclerophora amabilis]|nr:MAG: hypothetical protein M1837_004948 [Sclerophora amabilis]
MCRFGPDEKDRDHFRLVLSNVEDLYEDTLKIREVPSRTNIKPLSRTPMKCRPVSSALFTQRQGVLGVLESFFVERSPGCHDRREFLLHGISGAGKTQLALKFAEKNKNRFEYIFRVDSSNKDTLEQSYIDIASRISGKSDKDHSLEAFEREWLLLFDGADEIDTISRLWPPGIQGNVLYTSRNPMLRSLPSRQARKVDTMNEGDAVTLLLKSARLDELSQHFKDVTLPIVRELGCLALAIDQAGAYIASGECCIRDFLETFQLHSQDLLQNEAYKGASSYDRAVYATWDLSYDAISKSAHKAASGVSTDSGSSIALQILNVCAFFHFENIMEKIFQLAAENPERRDTCGLEIDPEGEFDRNKHLPQGLLRLDHRGKWDSHNFRQGIHILLSYSLLSRDESGQCYSMHRLIHGWAHDRLTVDDKIHYSRCASATLGSSSLGTRDYAFRRALLPHIITCRRHRALISDANLSVAEDLEFSSVFLVSGHNIEAQTLSVQAVELSKRVLGATHPKTLISMNFLAWIYSCQGERKKAEEILLQCFEGLLSQDLGHPSTLFITLQVLARTYICQERREEAEELLLQCWEGLSSALDPAHPSRLAVLEHLARTYIDHGRWKKAEELLLQDLEASSNAVGPAYPYGTRVLDTLARIYAYQGRRKEAEKLLRQVLESLSSEVGPAHPSTLFVSNTLAGIYTCQGRWKEAKELKRPFEEDEKAMTGDGACSDAH